MQPRPLQSHAAVTAVSATAVRIAANSMAMGVRANYQPYMTAAVVRLGT